MGLKIDEIEEELTIDKVASGDRPSLFVLGLAASQALKQTKCAVLMVDMLGRVRLMPTDSIKVVSTPRIDDSDLHHLSEDDAINILILQGDSEDQILSYLYRRKSIKNT